MQKKTEIPKTESLEHATIHTNGTAILPTAEQPPKPEEQNISYRQELFRKSIHLCSLSIPIIYAYIDRTFATVLLTALFVPAFGMDIARYRVPAIRQFINRFFSQMMRPHELDENVIRLSGATYVLMAALLCVMLFPKIIGVTAFAVMIVSDICSALIGRKFGSTPFLDKSLQGTTAFAVSAWCVVGVIGWLAGAPREYFVLGCLASVIGAVAEAASKRLRMDDNLSIPLSIGLTMWGLALLLHAATQEQLWALLRV